MKNTKKLLKKFMKKIRTLVNDGARAVGRCAAIDYSTTQRRLHQRKISRS